MNLSDAVEAIQWMIAWRDRFSLINVCLINVFLTDFAVVIQKLSYGHCLLEFFLEFIHPTLLDDIFDPEFSPWIDGWFRFEFR